MESFFVGPDGNPDKCQLFDHIGGGGKATLWKASVTLVGGQLLVAVKMSRIDHLGADDPRPQCGELCHRRHAEVITLERAPSGGSPPAVRAV